MKTNKFIENLDTELPELIKSFYPLVFLRRIYLTITISASKNIFNNAASGAFYFLLSIIPLALFFVYVLDAWLSDYGKVSTMFFQLLSYINPEFNKEYFDKMGLLQGGNKLYGFVGIIALIWSIRLVFNSIRSTFNVIFETSNKRGIIRNSLVDLIFIPIILVSSVLFLLLNRLMKELEILLIKFDITLFVKKSYINIFTDINFVLLSILTIYIIYKFIPAIKIKWIYALSGSLFFVISVFIVHYFLSKVIAYGYYHIVYGLISAVIIGLIWAYVIFFLLYFYASYIYVQNKSLEIEFIKWFSVRAGKGNFIDKFLFSKGFKSFQQFYIPFSTGEILFKEGDKGEYIYLLLNGNINLFVDNKFIQDVGINSFFGESGVVGECVYNSTAECMVSGSCLKLPKEFYQKISNLSPEILKAILDTVVMRKS